MVRTTVPIVSGSFSSSVDPVEFTRCTPMLGTDALIEQRFCPGQLPKRGNLIVYICLLICSGSPWEVRMEPA